MISKKDLRQRLLSLAAKRIERLLSLANTIVCNSDNVLVIRDALRLYEYLVKKHLSGTKFFEQEVGCEIVQVEFFGEEKLGSGKIVCIADKKIEN